MWKPLIGPNDDWPLGICDYTTVQPEGIVKADVLHVDRVTENQLLYPDERHRWYFVKDQQTTDLIVFRNTDSTGTRAGRSGQSSDVWVKLTCLNSWVSRCVSKSKCKGAAENEL